jgi:hypothetical protein
MARNEDKDIDDELLGEDEENVGDDNPRKKRERRRKSKEERVAERRVIFWTLLVIVIITIGFWLAPKIGGIFQGEPFEINIENKKNVLPIPEKPKNTNYMEITL